MSYNTIGAARLVGPSEGTLLEMAVNEKPGGGNPPAVGIIMGSSSDWKTMSPAAQVLDELGIPYEKRVVSAHRTPDNLFQYAGGAEGRGLSLIIAGAGGAAHLPGMTAAKTVVPVVGVPVIATPLDGFDALLSIMQMPAGVGVATVGVGEKGAKHAAFFAAAALALKDSRLRARLRAVRGLSPAGTATPEAPGKVTILAEGDSDFQVLQNAEEYLAKLGVPHERVIVNRAAAPGGLARQVADLEAGGTAVFIAGSGRGIDFACEVARATALPVLGIPILVGPVGRLDEFLRPFLDLPPGVAMFAVGRPGAVNAALFAATIVSGRASEVWEKLRRMREEQEQRVRAMTI
jgi:5-(carboxyamino)imidazole ribonucleotide mutase